jgi:DNA-3-methyladenine glycosylase I
MKQYSQIFSKVETALRSYTNLSKVDFDSEFGWAKHLTYKKLTDKNIYWKLVCVAFYSGMRASTVTNKLPSIKKHLHDFKKVSKFSKKEIRNFLTDPGTIHHIQKIEACVANAKELSSILAKFGTFTNYLARIMHEERVANGLSY